jgi:hypothetical protein
MGFSRRTFLHKAGLALLALEISDIGLLPILPWLRRYERSLAQTTAGKLALLVGINEYPQGLELAGCLTDVELQQELLIHRFGFNPKDIVTLTGQQATRNNIETALVEHLTKQAASGDIVVFHFSSYGSQVKFLDGKLVNSLVPVDVTSLTGAESGVNHLLLDTLMLWARSLATDKLTLILDTSYSNPGKLLQGNLRIRSYPNPPTAGIISEELAFQQELNKNHKQSNLPGILLSAAGENQLATEATYDGFSAGLFTYALTQYLWQVTPPTTIQINARQAAEVLALLRERQQQPQIQGNIQQPKFPYFLASEHQFGAEGVVTAIDAGSGIVELKLSGLPVNVLENYGVNSRLETVPIGNEKAKVAIQIESRQGLKAKAKIIQAVDGSFSSPSVGQFVQEKVRLLPRNLGLNVALSSDLTRIERVDATSAFSTIAVVSSVANAGEQKADCLLARVTKVEASSNSNLDTASKKLKSENIVKQPGGYGLFSVGGIPIPNTQGVANEAVKSAVNRLHDRLETLLAAKLWQLTVNEGSSRLGVRVTLEQIDRSNKIVMSKETGRFLGKMPANRTIDLQSQIFDSSNLLPSLPQSSQIQYRLENYSDRPLYFLIVQLNSDGKAIALYCPQLDPNSENHGVASQRTSIVPDPSNSFKWIVSRTPGIAQMQIIISSAPFSNTLKVLATLFPTQDKKQVLVELTSPLKVARALLEDLHEASRVSLSSSSIPTDVYALDVNAWASFSFVCAVI